MNPLASRRLAEYQLTSFILYIVNPRRALGKPPEAMMRSLPTTVSFSTGIRLSTRSTSGPFTLRFDRDANPAHAAGPRALWRRYPAQPLVSFPA